MWLRLRLGGPALAALALAFPARSAFAAPAGQWMSHAPPEFSRGVCCYDPVRHRFIQLDVASHAWALDLERDSTWTQLTASG